MDDVRHQPIADLLAEWLAQRLPPEGAAWLADTRRRLAAGATERELFLAVAMVARKVGRAELGLTAGDMAAAEALRHGWRPDLLSTDEAARICLVLTGDRDPEVIARRLERLCAAADVSELVAFYRGLPLYPDPSRHVVRATEGVRSNMRSLFEAVAHDNPYPAENFSESGWNQMVLKALFIGSPLHPIVGLDRRANAPLMRMLCDYAHERWAAQRAVRPELWRCVGPYADDEAMDDLGRVLRSGELRERQAAWLALTSCPHPMAASLRREASPEIRDASWAELAC